MNTSDMRALSASEPRTLITHPELRSHKSLPFFTTLGEKPKNPLERLLSLFADVRAGEGVGALLLTINVFLLLAGYSLMKPARDGLVLTEGGAEVASYSAAAQAVLLMGVVPFYGWLGTKVVRIRLSRRNRALVRRRGRLRVRARASAIDQAGNRRATAAAFLLLPPRR